MRAATLRLLPLLAAGLALAACAGGGSVPGPEPRRGVPGFDTREYPGAAALARWREASPYRWVGYYLEAPCRARSTWMGRRSALEQAGWGLAVLYVGEQQWADTTSHSPAAGGRLRCSRRNLTGAQGAADGGDAVQVARAEGFPAGTRIFLDVERVDSVSAELEEYVRAWMRALLDDGTYRPGLYAHDRNATALYALLMRDFSERGAGTGPAVWVARSGNFDLDAAPRESGHPYARVWQGRFDVDETWGGATIRIDANVADGENPSAPE